MLSTGEFHVCAIGIALVIAVASTAHASPREVDEDVARFERTRVGSPTFASGGS